MKVRKFKLAVRVFNQGIVEYKLSRLAAERLYYADCRAKGERIVTALPVSTKNQQTFELSNGSMLKRDSKTGPRPFVVFGEGAEELLKAQSII